MIIKLSNHYNHYKQDNRLDKSKTMCCNAYSNDASLEISSASTLIVAPVPLVILFALILGF